MAAKTRMRLGTPADLKCTDEVMKKHKQVKESVVSTLRKLADQSEGLIIEQVDEEFKEIGARLAGRGIVIASGVASIVLLSNPVGAAVGIGGIIIGYLIVGGSKLYGMKCKKEKYEKIKKIQEELENEIQKYSESQNRVFHELDMYDVFTVGIDFKENLKRIQMIVENAERDANMDCTRIEEFLLKLKKQFNKLPTDKKEKLVSTDFLFTMKSLFGGADNTGTLGVPDLVTGVGSVAIDAASSAPWWELIHGLNILVNVGFFVWDIKKLDELRKMQNMWKSGGEDKQQLLKNSKFQNEIKLRDMILEIRDNILQNGY